MNNTTVTSFSTNIQFLSVCQYISTFSTFFINIDLMTVDKQNQTVPVVNALFQYLNKSTNETSAKIQLLQKVLNKNDAFYGIENATLDMKYVNATYRYIINASLFNHYGNVTAYFAEIINKIGNKTSSNFRDIVFKNLSENYIDNICCTKNGTTKLTPPAIQKLLEGYIWPVYNQERGTKRIPSDINLDKLGKLNRFKRHPTPPLEPDLENLFENFYFNELEDDESNGFYDLVNFVETDQLGSSSDFFSNILDMPEDIRGELSDNINIDRSETVPPPQTERRVESQEILKKENADDNDDDDDNTSPPTKMRRIVPGNDMSERLPQPQTQERLEIQENLQMRGNDDATPPAKIQMIFTKDDRSETLPQPQTQEHLEIQKNLQNEDNDGTTPPTKIPRVCTGNEKSATNLDVIYKDHSYHKFEPIIWADNGKSKRMQAIERAALFISSCISNYTINESSNLLKGYLLKLEASSTPVPTYDQLARDFCCNQKVLESYTNWSISEYKHDFVNDVLFQSNFDDIRTFANAKVKIKHAFVKKTKLNREDFEKYKSSPLLRKSLRVQDFFLLKMNYKNINKITGKTWKRTAVAFYRLALRECEESWMEDRITLYHIKSVKIFYEYVSNLLAKGECTFENFVEFYSSFDGYLPKSPLIYTIKFKNMAGVASIDRLFEGYIGKYIIFPNTTFLVKGLKNDTISVEMFDGRSKEEKMIDMIKELYKLLTDSTENLFHYYN